MGLGIFLSDGTGHLLIQEIIQSLAREYGWPGFAPTEYVEAEVDPKIYQFDF
jgi:hypothetical protein